MTIWKDIANDVENVWQNQRDVIWAAMGVLVVIVLSLWVISESPDYLRAKHAAVQELAKHKNEMLRIENEMLRIENERMELEARSEELKLGTKPNDGDYR